MKEEYRDENGIIKTPKFEIYVKKTHPKKGLPNGSWMAHSPYSYTISFGEEKQDAIDRFIKNFKLRNYKIVER